jgi:hypothetical protein
MSRLQESIDRLSRWLRSLGAPAWSELAFVEISKSPRFTYPSTGGMVRIHVAKGQLQSVESYESRFEHLLDQGYAWINLNGCGLLGTTLIVLVEVPRAAGRVPRDRVSVNVSGPQVMGGWDASDRIELEPEGFADQGQ